jgi:outer membrane lipoprotein SlyB
VTRTIAALAIAIVLVAGCVSNVSPSTYSVGSVGQVNRTVAATVISVRGIGIAGTTALGGTAGAATGAAAGSGIGGSNARANIVGAIGGAIVGGLVGASIEANATGQTGMEYVVETENGNLMTIVQGSDSVFVVGQRVLVLYGSPARLIVDPRPNR